MKSEQVVPIMNQHKVVAEQLQRLDSLVDAEPEQPESSVGLSLQERLDKIVDQMALVRGADKSSPTSYHHVMVGQTPRLKIPYDTNTGDKIELYLNFDVNWQMKCGAKITATWFTYAEVYGGAGLPPHQEIISQYMVNEARKRSTSPYPEKVAKDFSNFEWSLDAYLSAARQMTPAELIEVGFPESSLSGLAPEF